MLAQQVRCRGAHGVAVQRAKHPAHPAGFHTGAHRRLQQHVGIAPRRGAGACVKGCRHMPRPLHRDVGRQKGIGAAHPGRGRARHFGVEMHHLQQAMHACIGAPGAQGAQRHGGKTLQCAFQRVLHGLPTFLALPAVVVATVVADAQRYPHGSKKSGSADSAGRQQKAACCTGWSAWARVVCLNPCLPATAGRGP